MPFTHLNASFVGALAVLAPMAGPLSHSLHCICRARRTPISIASAFCLAIETISWATSKLELAINPIVEMIQYAIFTPYSLPMQWCLTKLVALAMCLPTMGSLRPCSAVAARLAHSLNLIANALQADETQEVPLMADAFCPTACVHMNLGSSCWLSVC